MSATTPHHLCAGAGCPACGWSGDAARAVQSIEGDGERTWVSPLTGERLRAAQIKAAAVGTGYRRDRPMDVQLGAEFLTRLTERDFGACADSPNLWALLSTDAGEAWFPVEMAP